MRPVLLKRLPASPQMKNLHGSHVTTVARPILSGEKDGDVETRMAEDLHRHAMILTYQ